ncbi:hypothetical protein J5N97_002078 [Dioscorea zingiberensis]|uniref:Uncharacterized protein n=1 Tax=Dioscorea zingiberensis TaxID=325984 RepID=A0A9D5BT61_9LILI|nr:hypothetical protein J5N97_002078 [Dioscorea zingiberensis]
MEMALSLFGLGSTSFYSKKWLVGYSQDLRRSTVTNMTVKPRDEGNPVINYVVDAADRDSVPISESELHELLMKPSLSGIPLLVLGNKIDKSEALSKQALVDQLGLEHIKDREVCCHMISCKDSINIDIVIDRFIKHSRTTK